MRTVSNFLKNSRRYSQVKLHQRYQWHWWQIFLPVLLMLLTLVANLPPVSTIPLANLPPVSITPAVANNGNNYQTADNLKWTWRKKVIYMLTLLPKCFQKKKEKIFWLKIFSICHPCQRHQWCALELWISPQIFEKIWNSPNGIIRGLGGTDPCRKPEVKNLVSLSL